MLASHVYNMTSGSLVPILSEMPAEYLFIVLINVTVRASGCFVET